MAAIPRPGGHQRYSISAVGPDGVERRSDSLATEEPLQIRIAWESFRHSATITMRTPGADFELAAGFLLTERVIRQRDDILRLEYCVADDVDEEQRYNIVTVQIRPGTVPDLSRIGRQFARSSSCGVCGKESLDQIASDGIEAVGAGPTVPKSTLLSLPERLRDAQGVFDRTGGLHAAGLFDAQGTLLEIREDVGRHNAVDKVLGWALLDGCADLSDSIMMVSGRIGFEIAQKCAVAGVPILCAVSAPSSLAVDLARQFRMTMVGFLRDDRFNIYAHPERIVF